MARELVFKSEVQAAILAGVVLRVRCAQLDGGDVGHIRGVLAMAEHTAIVLGCDWSAILDDSRQALGTDVGQLIDGALALEAGHVH